MNKHIQTSLFEEVLTGNSYIEFTKALGLITKNPTPDKFGKALYKWSKSELKKTVNTLCLFSGAGGLDIGFHDAGFNIVECVELEAKFVKSLEANKLSGKYLKNTNIVCQDIREYEPDLDVKIDFIIGGPPCQSFSKAGIRAAGARGTKDSLGVDTDLPQFMDGGQNFTAQSMDYNFETKKGLVVGSKTKQDDGYLHGDTVKSHLNNEYHVKHGKYTTCELDHPHYYFNISKAIVKPNDKIVAGPLMLYVDDLPTPLALPFGFFPNKNKNINNASYPLNSFKNELFQSCL